MQSRGEPYDHNPMRINKFLAASGLGSRRNVEEIVLAGRVTVNGNRITDLSTFIEPGRDRVTVDGRAVRLPEGHTYYLLHKPEGIMTTARDPEGRSTVLQLVPARPRVFPVGRLDRETSGALLLTDDGPLAHRILHPRYGVEKEYIAVVEGRITDEAMSALREGVLLEGERRPTAPAMVDVLERKNHRSRLRLTVHEGRNRQVRRMLEEVGFPVLQLRRERIGPIALGDLAAGLHRVLNSDEVAALRRETARPRSTRRPQVARSATPPRTSRSSTKPRNSRSSTKPRSSRSSTKPRTSSSPVKSGSSRSSTKSRTSRSSTKPQRSSSPTKSKTSGESRHAVPRTRKAPAR